MHAQRHVLTVTTAADGTATAYTPNVTGRVLAIVYVKPGSGGYDNGVDFTITAEATGQTLWTESNVNGSKAAYPREQVHGTDGAAATLDGARAMREAIVLANDRVKVVLAQGGATKVGTFHVVIG